eukprot:IDg7100t1
MKTISEAHRFQQRSILRVEIVGSYRAPLIPWAGKLALVPAVVVVIPGKMLKELTGRLVKYFAHQFLVLDENYSTKLRRTIPKGCTHLRPASADFARSDPQRWTLSQEGRCRYLWAECPAASAAERSVDCSTPIDLSTGGATTRERSQYGRAAANLRGQTNGARAGKD